ncbi:PREDICTED: high affinity immunoglobulin epsilon receptor subunit gamma [Nipponia nippon]|uniref:high affinity immunoglobulin epsilon receptor subunit gamma n=1 Tax=Nipponia nippon TaxID=128390 RepID=UPI000510AB95|nr:PREDICTED: high affinity immunoglobulin epsilon receptor subunit gamma [Nipponia nippon]
MGVHLLLTAALLLLRTPAAEALMEPEMCYVLDAILFIYGIILTVLYCRLKFLAHRASRQGPGKEVMALSAKDVWDWGGLGLGSPGRDGPSQPAPIPNGAAAVEGDSEEELGGL